MRKILIRVIEDDRCAEKQITENEHRLASWPILDSTVEDLHRQLNDMKKNESRRRAKGD
jgi:hypothetical protein